VTFANEIPNCVLVLNLNFENFDSHGAAPPSSLEYDAVAAFGNLFTKFELLERNLHGSVEGARVEGIGQIELALLLRLNLDALLVLVAQ
jgi:hypothetical protein